MKRPPLAPLFAAFSLVLLSGCVTVDEGPTPPVPDPNAGRVIHGIEPEPAPIPQKNVPEGESPLRHRKPDERIDRPND